MDKHHSVLAFSLHITGLVQGVFFRASSKEKADKLGISGWVKNNTDGSVSTFIQGSRSACDEFIHWCNDGPSGSDVINVQCTSVSPSDSLSSFNIKY